MEAAFSRLQRIPLPVRGHMLPDEDLCELQGLECYSPPVFAIPDTFPKDVQVQATLNGVQVPVVRTQPKTAPKPTTPMLPSYEGLEAISGVPDSTSSSPSGKLMCGLMAGSLREVDFKHLSILSALVAAPPNARIYKEKCGTGHTYHRVRYHRAGRAGTVYLGNPAPELLRWMQAILDENRVRHEIRREARATFNRERISMLRSMYRHVQRCASRIARTAGYSFKGYTLRKTKKA